jgi:peptidoglycan/LPS O-acetylase OafA/YrhL
MRLDERAMACGSAKRLPSAAANVACVLELSHGGAYAQPSPRRAGPKLVEKHTLRERDAPGRLPAIDILRGLAIVWVVLFHVWGDIEFFPGAPSDYYDQLTDRVGEGDAWASLTALTDLLFRLGFQGVPLFMMISGISLTIAAYRADARPDWPRFFVQRFRKLMLPYWAGVVLTYGVMAGIAWRQASISDISFGDAFSGGVTISQYSVINVDRGAVWASFALVPRLIEDEWFFAPQLALWFVGLIAQYYLLFPLLFLLMRRAGVVAFLVVTFAITVGANWWIVDRYGAPEFKFALVTGWAPFRLFEFTSGMAIGWLLAAPSHERDRALAVVRHPATIALLIVLGFVAHTTGDLLIGRWTARYWQSMALPLSTLGLAMMVLPLLVRRPGGLEASVVMRGLILLGVMSYTLLIVSDAMRLVASQIRVETGEGAIWWTFLVGVYVPLTVLIAWPMAHLLGLMPQRRTPAPEVPERAPATGDEALAPAPAQ